MTGVKRRRAEWSDLRLFWAVAESGGFGAAARALRISQSTITRRIDELEHRLNARLFVRTPQGVRLTEPGKLAYDRVLTMERSAEAIENLIVNAEDKPCGSVGIASPDGVAGIYLTRFLPEFMHANPNISLRFDCGMWPDHPLDGDNDISLTFAEPAHADLVAAPLAHFHYGLFASRSYLDLYGTPKSLAECADHIYVHHTAQMYQQDKWHPKGAAFRTMANVRLETNSSAVSFAAIRDGAGIGVMPTGVLSIAPELVMLDTPPMGSIQLWMCWHRDIDQAARLRQVRNWISDLFDARTKPWFREEYVHPRDFMHLITGEEPSETAVLLPRAVKASA